MTNPEQLTCLSILICDDIFRDERTKKLVIVGTFNYINAVRFPCRHPRMRILITLTNGRGRYELKLSIRSAATDQPLLEMKGDATFKDPTQIVDIDMEIRDLQFPEPGKYWVVLEADDQIIQQRPFVVTQAREAGPPQA